MTQTLILEISNLDEQLAKLYAQIKKIKAQKSEARAQKRKADRVLSALKVAVDDALKLSAELGQEFADSAIAVVRDIVPKRESTGLSFSEPKSNLAPLLFARYLLDRIRVDAVGEGQLVENAQKTNDSNELYVWQPTDNPNIASYFDVAKGSIHCTYLGVTSKQKGNMLAAKLRSWFPSVSLEQRTAARLKTPYELKVSGLSDRHINWLAKQDFGAIASWENPQHLFFLATDLNLSLAQSTNRRLLKEGMKVFNPKNNTEYILQDWGEMRARVYDPESNQYFYHYLVNLEIRID